jgi:hypothetical protein
MSAEQYYKMLMGIDQAFQSRLLVTSAEPYCCPECGVLFVEHDCCDVNLSVFRLAAVMADDGASAAPWRFEQWW